MLVRFQRAATLEQLQKNLENILKPVTESYVVDGRYINDITLQPWVDNLIEHKLGREILGWAVVEREKILSVADVYRDKVDQVIPTNTSTLVGFTAELLDEGNNFDITTHLYTAPVSGDYSANSWLTLQTGMAAGTSVSLAFIVNAAVVNWFRLQAGGIANYMGAQGNFRTRLNAGDTLGVHVYQNSGGDTDLMDHEVNNRLQVGLIDEGITENMVSSIDKTKFLHLRTSYTHKVSLWVF